jgi:hypothetical protein
MTNLSCLARAGLSRRGESSKIAGENHGAATRENADVQDAAGVSAGRTLFPDGQGMSPYLADWRRAFAGLDLARSAPVALVFDRGPCPPAIEAVRVPWPCKGEDRRLAELHLAALANNILCIRGARRLSVLAPTEAMGQAIAEDLTRHLLLRPDALSDRSLVFLHTLVRQVFAADFTIDADREHALALHQEAAAHSDASCDAPPGPGQTRPGTVLSVNIGQHLTSQALVRIEADGRFAVEHLTRRETFSPDGGQCLSAHLDALTADARALAAGCDRAVDAVGVSIAATIFAGRVRAVPECGLYAGCGEADIRHADAALRRAFAAIAPGRPVTVRNDGETQALFAFRYGQTDGVAEPGGNPADARGGLLSVRLGACPAVHVLDAAGRARPGFHEYGWCITRYAPRCSKAGLFTTIRPYISHYGVAVAAHELGLLQRHRLHPEAAIPFFHEALGAQDAEARRDALRVYGVLGAHLAMLAAEVARQEPVGVLRLLGSRANRIDAAAFAAMADGFDAFAAGHGLSVAGMRLELLEDASPVAGLVGAALAALRRP